MPQRKSTVSGEKPLNIGQVSFQLAGGVAVILNLKFVPGAGIDNGGISMGVDAFHCIVIAFVDMAVDPVPGVVGVDKLPEAFKALVSRIRKVTVACNGGVGKDDIHTLVFFQLPLQLAAMNCSNIYPQMLTIEAAHTMKKETIYQAAMMDPHTGAQLSTDEIVALCNELYEAHEKAGYPIF